MVWILVRIWIGNMAFYSSRYDHNLTSFFFTHVHSKIKIGAELMFPCRQRYLTLAQRFGTKGNTRIIKLCLSWVLEQLSRSHMRARYPLREKNRGHNRNNATSPKIKTVATLWTIRKLTSSWELIIVFTTRIIGFFKFRYINVPFWKRELVLFLWCHCMIFLHFWLMTSKLNLIQEDKIS